MLLWRIRTALDNGQNLLSEVRVELLSVVFLRVAIECIMEKRGDRFVLGSSVHQGKRADAVQMRNVRNRGGPCRHRSREEWSHR